MIGVTVVNYSGGSSRRIQCFGHGGRIASDNH
jgi:hypothetical protein